jgi:hypothetical protein
MSDMRTVSVSQRRSDSKKKRKIWRAGSRGTSEALVVVRSRVRLSLGGLGRAGARKEVIEWLVSRRNCSASAIARLTVTVTRRTNVVSRK